MNGNVVESTRKLVAHENLLIQSIQKQAGSIKKAILEGVMNSIEAGSTRVEVKFDAVRSDYGSLTPRKAFLSIYDNGTGIPTKNEIILHFETFGQPHEDNERGIWKRFRMGRGQMFRFGRNTWRTASFEMVVDIENDGLKYILRENLPFMDGCKIDIELYNNPLDNYSIPSVESFKDDVHEQVKYVKVPVYFNGKMVSSDPANLNWDYEDENAYYRFDDTSLLKFYNLGAFVKSEHLSKFAVGGIVVSKKQLQLNYPRNDIEEDCPVLLEIVKVLRKNAVKKQTKKYESLTKDERLCMLRDFRDDIQDFYRLKGARIFRTAQEKWMSWNMLTKDGRPWCFAPVGSRIADKAMEMGAALCLDDSMLKELNFNGFENEFFDWLTFNYRENSKNKLWDALREKLERDVDKLNKSFILFDGNQKVSSDLNIAKLKDMFDEDYQYIPYSKLRKSEKLIVDTLENLHPMLWDNRKIRIGVSTVAAAWTDGSSFIAFDRTMLKKLELDKVWDILKLFLIACHELSHCSNTAGTHYHGADFYEKYYEITNRSFHKNPMYYISKFRDTMKRMKIIKKMKEEEEKEKKANEELGVVRP